MTPDTLSGWSRFRQLLRPLRFSWRIRHAITSARRTIPVCFGRHAGRSPPLGRGSAFGVWLERRAELEEDTVVELDAARTTTKTLAMQLKSSRCAEEEERSACAALRNRVGASQASTREVLASIGEDMRAVSRDTELLRFRLATTHTELAESRTFVGRNTGRGPFSGETTPRRECSVS